MDRQYLTVAQAAARLGVHERTVLRWVKAGELPGALVGGRKAGYRIPADEIERRLAEGVPTDA